MPQGAANAARLIAIIEDPDSGLPANAIATLKVLVAVLTHLETEIGRLDAEIARRAKESDVARRLMTVPGICPLIATALAVLAPPSETFRRGETSRPGLASRHGSIQPAASSGSAPRRRWASDP